MTATHEHHSTVPTVPVLYFSLELGGKIWKLAFTIGLGQKPRLRTIAARNIDALLGKEKGGREKKDITDINRLRGEGGSRRCA
jgi:hypothetical protein